MSVYALPRLRIISLAIFVLSLSAPAVVTAEDIFDSVLCRAFGCVLLHNSYDVSLYLMVGAEGAPAIEWQRSVAQSIPTVEKGSRDVLSVIDSAQSSFLGFDRDGDGLAESRFDDTNDSGYLDAGDSIQAERLRQSTRLIGTRVFPDTAFWVAANAPFGLRAKAILENRDGELGASGADFANYELDYAYSRNGRVADVRYGRFTRNAFCNVSDDISSLADITPQPRTIIRCARRSVVYNNARSDLMDFSSLIDASYSIANGYDLSIGVGAVEFSVIIDVLN